MEERIDALQGQILALNTIVAELVKSMGPVQAAEAAVAVAIERQAAQAEDQSEGTSPAQARARDTVLAAYLDLLSAIAQR